MDSMHESHVSDKGKMAILPNRPLDCMKQLLSLIGEQTVDVVLIENPDRLVLFGLGNLKQAFRWKDVCLEVYEPPKHQ